MRIYHNHIIIIDHHQLIKIQNINNQLITNIHIIISINIIIAVDI